MHRRARKTATLTLIHHTVPPPPPQPPKPCSDSPVILTLSIIKALGENSRQIPVTNYTAY